MKVFGLFTWKAHLTMRYEIKTTLLKATEDSETHKAEDGPRLSNHIF
jgi:hypothetical protein